MSRITDVVEGWTGRLTFTLMSQAPSAAVASAFVGTGLTLSDLVLKNQTGDLVPTAGDFGWVSAAAGTVYYDPDAADLLATGGAHTIRFQVTDGAGKVVFFPSGKADEIKVFKP
jgi:hypothetical protein